MHVKGSFLRAVKLKKTFWKPKLAEDWQYGTPKYKLLARSEDVTKHTKPLRLKNASITELQVQPTGQASFNRS